MDGYLLFALDGTYITVTDNDLNPHNLPEGVYVYSFYSKKWFIRLDGKHSWWDEKQPEDVPKQHRAALLIYT